MWHLFSSIASDDHHRLDRKGFVAGCRLIGLVPHILTVKQAETEFTQLCAQRTAASAAAAESRIGGGTTFTTRRLLFSDFCAWSARRHLTRSDDAENDSMDITIAPVQVSRAEERRVLETVAPSTRIHTQHGSHVHHHVHQHPHEQRCR